MARSKSQSQALNMALLAVIVAGTQSTGFANAVKSEAEPLAKAGLIELAPDAGTAAADAQIACRATDAGIQAHAAASGQAAPAPAAQPAAGGFPATDAGLPTPEGTADVGTGVVAPATTPAPAAPAPKLQIAVVTGVPLPETTAKQRPGKQAIYPFDSLTVGAAFFVPATADRPEPWKTLNSTVSSAAARYAKETGQMKSVTRKGVTKQVPETVKEREFTIRHVPDGAAFGQQYAGVEGAGIWRTK